MILPASLAGFRVKAPSHSLKINLDFIFEFCGEYTNGHYGRVV